MPVRAIKRLELERLIWHLPAAIKQSYISLGDNTFEVLVQRHFDKSGNVVRTIGQHAILSVSSREDLQRFELSHHPLIRRYGVLCLEYLEITFLNKLDEQDHEVREPIFPEREIEELDIPVKSE